MSNTATVKMMKGMQGRASLKDLFLPNSFTSTQTATKTIKKAPTAMEMADHLVRAIFQVSGSAPPAATASLTVAKAVLVGVPTAP